MLNKKKVRSRVVGGLQEEVTFEQGLEAVSHGDVWGRAFQADAAARAKALR